ncbi:hypothetical protein R1sor_010841 [Riccia sorocarpa]|uniref:F-box domain-containing protein n=1 Tax=Riccia sorocarpa TaxID=122646 RepID=A0ABD3HZ63_9MARC
MEGSWTSLMSKLLADVFLRLPSDERITTISLVCKVWKRAALEKCGLAGEMTHEFCGLDLPDGDQDAMVIGSYLQGLKNLELKKTISLTDYGLMHIASGCRDLESLNLALLQ